MVDTSKILDHAQVVDVNGEHVGIVDHLDGEDKIKLAKSDPEAGGKHHLIPISWVKDVDDNKVVLSKSKSDVEKEWQSV
ncbi:DUF2171 domain-containing protein [Rouxiella sp. T17]|uniref:DUF2171 domain-containing protein n=1 Tax=Rouxiella sp. T17 TaxID=3085684 RepID=UPI002FC663C3